MLRKDLVTSVFLMVLGLAMVEEFLAHAALHRCGLQHLGGAGHGARHAGRGACVILAFILFSRTVSARRAGAVDDAAGEPGAWRRIRAAIGLCVFYAGVMVGRMPFWLATFLFAFVFILFFELSEPEARARWMRHAAFALVIAALTSGIISYIFARTSSSSIYLEEPACKGFEYFITAVVDFTLNPVTLFHVAWATLLGITVGALPGLTATLGIALLTTLTFHMDSQTAILVLVCMYVGAIYGGSRSAILLNIPGTPASAATSLDGFPLARKGEAGQAMGLATSGSFLGSLIGMLALALIAPKLGEIALSFKSPEFFWLALFGVLISGQITTTGDSLKGWISGMLGLLVAMVGQEGIHAYQRFSYGWTDISGGWRCYRLWSAPSASPRSSAS